MSTAKPIVDRVSVPFEALVRTAFYRGVSTLADLSIGTAIVLIHVVLADRQALTGSRTQIPAGSANATANRGGWT